MKTMLFVTITACALTVSIDGASSAAEVETQELQSRVRSIFLAKCSECHGRGLSRPRAALYLHDLGQLAANREWVVPHEPEKSYLWTLIRDDDMPAKGAKAGALNAQEKEAVRAWIATGAPAPPWPASPPVAPLSASPPPESVYNVTSVSAPAPISLTRLLAWFGAFHVLVIHFPIALLAAAALAEAIAAWRGSRVPSLTVRFCVLVGAVSALAAVGSGWLHADFGGFGGASPSTLAAHRWLGTIAGLGAAAIALLSESEIRRGQRSVSFRIALWTLACLVAAAGHFGGLMVHGSNFLNL